MKFKNYHKIRTTANYLIQSLISIRLTVILLFILIPVVIAGSLIPQGRAFSEYARAYGIKMTELLFRLCLTTVYESPVFLILVAILGANILGCFLKSLTEKKRSLGFFLIHISLILLMTGGMISAAGRIQGELILQEGQSASAFESDNKKIIPLGFELQLKDFELQKYENQGHKLLISIPGRKKPYETAFKVGVWTAIPGTLFQFCVEAAVSDFRLDITTGTAFSASAEPNNPAIRVHIKGNDVDYTEWVFSRFDNFHSKSDRDFILKYRWAQDIPKAFISRVAVIENGNVIKEQAIEVNQPLRYKGFSIFQASYDMQAQRWSGLEIVKDPGVGLVYVSVILIMLGLVLDIYISPLLNKKKKSTKA